MVTHYKTDFIEVITKLREYYTLGQIRDLSGMSSHGHVGDLQSGRSATVSYDVGVLLVNEFQRIIKSERRKGAKK